MRGTEIREHITTLASATPHPSLGSDSGHQGDEWLRLLGKSPGESRAKKARSEGTVGSSPHCSWSKDCGMGVGGERVVMVGRGVGKWMREGQE